MWRGFRGTVILGVDREAATNNQIILHRYIVAVSTAVPDLYAGILILSDGASAGLDVDDACAVGASSRAEIADDPAVAHGHVLRSN